MMAGALLRMFMDLQPDRDWTALARVHNRLKQTAAPVRDKLPCMVSASDPLDLGIGLMDTCDRGQNETYKATRYRDGLNIALLICCPVRLKNLAGLMVGQHLVFDGQDKTGRPYIAAVPQELTPYIERWLQVHRPSLPLMATAKPWALATLRT